MMLGSPNGTSNFSIFFIDTLTCIFIMNVSHGVFGTKINLALVVDLWLHFSKLRRKPRSVNILLNRFH